MRIELATACERLKQADNIVILAHRKPDGDALGSSFGLLFALERLGKMARVECPDPIPEKFTYIYGGGEYLPAEFEPCFVVSVDVASMGLLTHLGERYQGRIDLCIDHHKSNEMFARETLLDADAAAAAQIVYHVVRGLGIVPDKAIADALFAGITTDTGGFRFSNTGAETHRVAAELIDFGADHAEINRLMFETKSRGRIEVDRLMLETLEFDLDGMAATLYMPFGIEERYGVTEEELDGVSSLPRTIQGVYAGVTIRDRGDGSFRVSLRTQNPVDASAICAAFGGGGHVNAAGCTVTGSLEEAKKGLLQAVKVELEKRGLIA